MFGHKPGTGFQKPSSGVIPSRRFFYKYGQVAMKHTRYRRVIRDNNFIKKYVVPLCCGVVAATPLASWASPLDLHDIEQALRCNDVAKWTQVMRDLGPWADQEVMAGRLVRTPLTQLRFSNEPILDYVFPAPIKLLGQETVGFASAMGMLPGVTVFFNATTAALRQAFERDGYALQCKTISELKGETCQASRPIPQDMVDPAWGNVKLQFVLTITRGEALLPPGVAMVACTVLPAEGNPFR